MTTEAAEPAPAPLEAEPPPLLVGPKRQHYLPRFYLEGFTGGDGCLAVYDREKAEVRRQQPVNTGVAGHIYTVTDDQGRKRFELEAHLAQIEAEAAEHFPALIAGELLTEEARGAISHFLAFLAVRTPEFIGSIQHFNGEMIKQVTKVMFSHEGAVAERLKNDPKHSDKGADELEELAVDLVDFARRGEFTVETDHQWAMTTALPMADSIAPILFERNWTVWTAPRGSAFVTADAPLVLTSMAPRKPSIYGLGFASGDALVIVPLSSTHALAIHGDGRKTHMRAIDGRDARRVNTEIARRSQRFLLARDDALVLAISQAAKLTETKWQPKFGMDLAPTRPPRR